MKKTILTLLLLPAMLSANAEGFRLDSNASSEYRLPMEQITLNLDQAERPAIDATLTTSNLTTHSITSAATTMSAEATKSAAEMKYGAYTPLRELEIQSAPLIAFGLIAKANKKNFRAARNNFIPSYENHLDDWSQHFPLIATTAMNFLGYEGRSNHWRYLTSGAMSYGFMALITNGIKYTAKEMRPDGSTANSFPSGHTATAFVAATIMHKEYGLTRSPWYSVAAYGCATMTGIMRTLNNRHWISDILVGAGIGVISTDLGYMMGDLIWKKKGILRNPRTNPSDMLKNPSFFRLELGMQMINNLTLPTSTVYTTTQQLYNTPGAAELDDDFYTIERYGNPFRIHDKFDKNNEYNNYAAGNPAYGENVAPKIKVSTGTTVAAEAAYFVNPYIGFGGRARITTAPVTTDGLYSYDKDMHRFETSAAVSDVWSIVDANIGVYGAWPISSKHNLGVKALYGRKYYSGIDLYAAYDAQYVNTDGQIANVTFYGDNLAIGKTNSESFTAGIHYTYAMTNGVALSAFFDYDFSKPEFDVEYAPYNTNVINMLESSSRFTYEQKMNHYTLGASMTILF